MTDIEEKILADMLFEKCYARMCGEDSYGRINVVSKEHVLTLFFSDTSSLSPIETMHLAIHKSADECFREERKRFSYLKDLHSIKSCLNCGFGNGEGGCTIPGYCTEMSEYWGADNSGRY